MPCRQDCWCVQIVDGGQAESRSHRFILILLAGGDKASQDKDIKTALRLARSMKG